MGAALGAVLVAAGNRVGWASAGRSEATAGRASRAGLEDAGELSALLGDRDIALSVCPPHAAEEVAATALAHHFRGLYVDANAISPIRSMAIREAVEGAGASYVDASIIGPPPPGAERTALYLSGPGAEQFGELFASSPVDPRPLGDEPSAASALKMAFAAWTKGSAALLLASFEAGDRAGVAAELQRALAESDPDLDGQLARARGDAAQKGWRWSGEMAEIAHTLDSLGLPAGFHEAAAAIFQTHGGKEEA